MNFKNYLALGDSYTIGEQVEIINSFPYQLIQLLRNSGLEFVAPEIIAKTGWTTDELLSHMEGYRFMKKYDIVTVLIGVNNQYRGRNVSDFEKDFEAILSHALNLVADLKNLFVLSIPDWGITPFGEGKDRLRVADEINAFNNTCQDICIKKAIKFIDITGSQRIDAANDEYLAADKLHPSAKEYKKWSEKIFLEIDPQNI